MFFQYLYNILYLENVNKELILIKKNDINKETKDTFIKEIEKLKNNLLKLNDEEKDIHTKINVINTQVKTHQDNMNIKNISLQKNYRNLEQFNASKDILTKLFESENDNIVINSLKFPKGYEKAIEASLGHGLKASLEKSDIEWRHIEQKSLFELPENIDNLDKFAKGVPEVLNILKLTGIVNSTTEGDHLQNKLKPGQQLVTKNGGLWRWDGYTHNEKAETPANQILQNKANLIEINSKIKQQCLWVQIQ